MDSSILKFPYLCCMIRYATRHDTNALKQLLKEVFDGSDRFIDMFFRLKFDGSNVCVYELEGQIVSMAFLLPATLLLKDGEHPATYLYACATRAKFRSKGYMKAVIDTVYADICRQNHVALLLMPAEESLYDYYTRCGFESYFYWDRHCYELRNFSWRNDCEEYALHKIDAACYADFRRRWFLFEGTVHWDMAHLQVLEKDTVGSDNGFYAVTADGELKACCLVWKRADTCEVEEWIGENIPYIQGLFFRSFDKEKVVITRPGKREKSALVKFNPKYRFLRHAVGYFNLPIS